MAWYRVEEASEEQSNELFKALDNAFAILQEADIAATPGRLEDLMNAKGIPVEIIPGDADSPSIVQTVPRN
jgi:hypothetical protein